MNEIDCIFFMHLNFNVVEDKYLLQHVVTLYRQESAYVKFRISNA